MAEVDERRRSSGRTQAVSHEGVARLARSIGAHHALPAVAPLAVIRDSGARSAAVEAGVAVTFLNLHLVAAVGSRGYARGGHRETGVLKTPQAKGGVGLAREARGARAP